MTPQLLFALKNKFAPASPEPTPTAEKYYHPYPFGLEIILIILLGIAGGLLFSAGDRTPQPIPNQPANNNNIGGGAIATGINDPDFNKSMPHILKWEGKCSDHPRDLGKRTYKGITLFEANRIGIKDPCTMSDSQVFKVYYDRYWVRVPKTLAYPEKLAYFNMIINGTKGRCLKLGNASAMLDCQQEHYNSIGSRDFADGWRNRNKYFKTVTNEIK